MKNIIIYEEEADSLILRKPDVEVKSCLNDGNDTCILELDKDEFIVGLEFLDIHKTFGVPLTVLRHLKNSLVKIRYEEAKKMIYITVSLLYHKERDRITIPIAADLGNKTFEYNNFTICAAA